MKKALLFLAVLLFVCGCKKEFVEEKPIAVGSVEYYLLNFNITDTEGIDLNTVTVREIWDENITGFSGIRNNKIWIALYESDSKQLIETWLINKPLSKDVASVSLPSILKIKNNEYIIGSLIDYKNRDKNDNNATIFIIKNNITSYSFYADNFSFQLVGKDKLWISTSVDKKGTSELINLERKHIADDISSFSIGDSTIYSGFKKDNKVWFCMYDSQENVIGEWDSKESLERNVKIHLGYGEYKDLYIQSLFNNNSANMILKSSWGYAICLNQSTEYNVYYYNLFLLNQDNVYPVEFSNNNEAVAIREWYNNSILLMKSDESFVYTSTGERINSFKSSFHWSTGSYESIIPCSYTDYIQNYTGANEAALHRINKYNLSKNEIVWRCDLPFMYELPDNVKAVCSLINKESNIWQFAMDIKYYDGTKKIIKFSVNIDNGKLTY